MIKRYIEIDNIDDLYAMEHAGGKYLGSRPGTVPRIAVYEVPSGFSIPNGYPVSDNGGVLATSNCARQPKVRRDTAKQHQ